MRCSLTRMPASAWPKRERSSSASKRVGRDQRGEHDVVEVVRCRPGRAGRPPTRARLDVQEDAVAAAAELGVVEHEVGHLREGQRDHDEVDAAGAQAERADEERVGRGRAASRARQQPGERARRASPRRRAPSRRRRCRGRRRGRGSPGRSRRPAARGSARRSRRSAILTTRSCTYGDSTAGSAASTAARDGSAGRAATASSAPTVAQLARCRGRHQRPLHQALGPPDQDHRHQQVDADAAALGEEDLAEGVDEADQQRGDQRAGDRADAADHDDDEADDQHAARPCPGTPTTAARRSCRRARPARRRRRRRCGRAAGCRCPAPRTMSRLLAPARIIMPSRVRLTTQYSAERDTMQATDANTPVPRVRHQLAERESRRPARAAPARRARRCRPAGCAAPRTRGSARRSSAPAAGGRAGRGS